MITFNVQADNGNYYRGHEPVNGYGNCWGDEEVALVFTIEQARELVEAWPGHLNIVISVKSVPMTDETFGRELFCIGGGSWYDYVFVRSCDPPCDGPCRNCEGRVT